MKKLLLILCTICLSALLFTACSDVAEETTKPISVKHETTKAPSTPSILGHKVKECPSYSGSGEIIGTYAIVKLSSEEFKNISPEEFSKAAKKIANFDYDYFTICDGDIMRGIQFPGCLTDYANYGYLNQEYMVIDTIKSYKKDANWNYVEE